MNQKYQVPASDHARWLYDLLKGNRGTIRDILHCGIVLLLLYVDATLVISKKTATQQVNCWFFRDVSAEQISLRKGGEFGCVPSTAPLLILLIFSTFLWQRNKPKQTKNPPLLICAALSPNTSACWVLTMLLTDLSSVWLSQTRIKASPNTVQQETLLLVLTTA